MKFNKINSEEFKKRIMAGTDVIMGYEPPIDLCIRNISSEITRRTDEQIALEIQRQINVNVDKEELERALLYDRNQYDSGYKNGYRDGKKAAIRILYNILKECLEEM